jgi:hypothetical protein
MRKRSAFAAVAVAALTVGAVATPAQADSVSGKCTEPYGVGTGHHLDGEANYTVVDDTWHKWHNAAGKVRADSGVPLGKKSNIHFNLLENHVSVWGDMTGDDVWPETWHSRNIDRFVARSSAEMVRWEAVFDLPWGSDPRCTAHSVPI